ncbi:MAG: hypothetical protein IPP15_00960 [Saprospiraceae bacterium]|uniref:DUF3108 domain-containing protein n=1 Tax=Candidatus Opimibacter skivensis TaxID=2982028 RepID=A0A9D7SU17_9BACT|nr:hypothetical protein [Candidatus Opimibacter skivensis]
MLNKIIFLIAINLFPLFIWSQSFEWEGYGKGLSYLKIKDGYVSFNGYNDADGDGGKLKEVSDQWIIYKQNNSGTGETYDAKIQVVNSSFDSLRLFIQDVPVNYYKPEYLKYINNYLFQDVSLEYLDNRGGFNYKIEFNRYGRIRYSDFDNKTLFEGTVDQSKINQFKDLIKYIDIRNLNISVGRQNVCDNREFRFVFRDMYFDEYSYRAISVPMQLMPVKEFLEDILKSNGHVVIWPRGQH